MIKNKKFIIVYHTWFVDSKSWFHERFTGTEEEAYNQARKTIEDKGSFYNNSYDIIEIKKTDDITLENLTLKLKLNDALWSSKIYKYLFYTTILLYIVYFIFK